MSPPVMTIKTNENEGQDDQDRYNPQQIAQTLDTGRSLGTGIVSTHRGMIPRNSKKEEEEFDKMVLNFEDDEKE